MALDYKALSDKELLEYEKLMQERFYEQLRSRYSDYVEYVNYPNFKFGKHIRFITKAVQELVEGKRFLQDGRKVKVIILTVPPQHGKSMSVTEAFPSWYLGKYPEKRVIIASYNSEFATKFGRKNRDKLERYGKEVFGLDLQQKPRTDTRLYTTKGGELLSAGIMGGITGNPADLIVLDDPVKNRQEADSETYRERMWEEYLNSVKSRFSADGYMILILTRWHEDDIAGRIIERESWATEVIRFPCEAEEEDVLGRSPGEPLFPEIGKDSDWMRDFKSTYVNDPSEGGLRAWNALYQCRPSTLEGNMFQRIWWRYWVPRSWSLTENLVRIQLPDGKYDTVSPVHLPDSFDQQMQSWDLTFKDKGVTVDNVAGGVFGTLGSRIFLLDSVYSPMSFVQTLSAIETMSKAHPKATLKLIEDKANGEAAYSMLQYKLHGIVMVNPQGSKWERANAVSPIVEAGNVYLPHPKLFPWVNALIDQMSSFPNAAHDDYVDMISQALMRFMYAVEKPPVVEKTYIQKFRENKMNSIDKARMSARRRYR